MNDKFVEKVVDDLRKNSGLLEVDNSKELLNHSLSELLAIRNKFYYVSKVRDLPPLSSLLVLELGSIEGIFHRFPDDITSDFFMKFLFYRSCAVN
jgi:hypothetical protein